MVDANTSWAGQYSDGKSAAQIDVTVQLSARELFIIDPNFNAKIARWKLADIKAGAPLQKHHPALLRGRKDDQARLLIKDADCVARLMQAAPTLTKSSSRRRQLQLVFIFLIVSSVGLLAFYYGWGAASTMIARHLPDIWRTSLGDYAERVYLAERRRCVNPGGLAALENLHRRLRAGRDKVTSDRLPTQVTVVIWSIKNAFALPDGRLVLTSGLLRAAQSPEEIAGILAHEIGHASEYHPTTGVIRQIGLSLLVSAVLGADEDVISAVATYLGNNAYSRDYERRADDIALQILRAAEISNLGLKHFFERLLRSANLKNKPELRTILRLLSTHPLNDERVDAILRSGNGKTRPALSPSQWQALRGICGRTIPPPKPA